MNPTQFDNPTEAQPTDSTSQKIARAVVILITYLIVTIIIAAVAYFGSTGLKKMATKNVFRPTINVSESYIVGNAGPSFMGNLETPHDPNNPLTWDSSDSRTRILEMTGTPTNISTAFQDDPSTNPNVPRPGTMFIQNLGETADDRIEIGIEPQGGTNLVILRPSSTGLFNWFVNDYQNIDDPVEQPATGDGLTCNATTAGDGIERWNIESAIWDNTATTGTLWIYGSAAGSPTVQARFYTDITGNSSWQTIPLTSSNAWHSVSWTFAAQSPTTQWVEVDAGTLGAGQSVSIDVLYFYLSIGIVVDPLDTTIMEIGPGEFAFFPIELSGSDLTGSNITNYYATAPSNSPVNLLVQEWAR